MVVPDLGPFRGTPSPPPGFERCFGLRARHDYAGLTEIGVLTYGPVGRCAAR